MRWISWQTTVELQSSTDRQTDRQTYRHPTYKLSNSRSAVVYIVFCTHTHTHTHTKKIKQTNKLGNVYIRLPVSLFVSKTTTGAASFVSTNFLWNNMSMMNTKRLATGWTVRRSNPGGGRDFPHPSRPALGPTQPPAQQVLGFFPRVKRPGRGVGHPPHLASGLKKE
jgi:hypothetical protein